MVYSRGGVISDDMQMGAITRHYGFEAAIQRAIEAGVDVIAIANNSVCVEDVVEQAVALIKRLVERGDESYRRIQRLKGRLRSG